MKKLVTLLITVFVAGVSFAQPRSYEESRSLINTSTKAYYPDNSSYDDAPRNEEIDRIYREYDRKIAAVRNNPFLSRDEKERRIRELEYERDRRIREIDRNYGGDRRYDNNYKKSKKYKNNPGKHKGWQKRKGNPHRDRNWDND